MADIPEALARRAAEALHGEAPYMDREGAERLARVALAAVMPPYLALAEAVEKRDRLQRVVMASDFDCDASLLDAAVESEHALRAALDAVRDALDAVREATRDE